METTLLFTVMSLAVMTSVDGCCPTFWTEFGDSCYKIINENVTWFEAQVICSHANSHLITIESKAEDDFAVQMARSRGNTWIGLTDSMQERNFVWENLKKPTYTHWAINQPDNGGGRENCAHLWVDFNYLWNDERCGENKFSAICEKQAT